MNKLSLTRLFGVGAAALLTVLWSAGGAFALHPEVQLVDEAGLDIAITFNSTTNKPEPANPYSIKNTCYTSGCHGDSTSMDPVTYETRTDSQHVQMGAKQLATGDNQGWTEPTTAVNGKNGPGMFGKW